MGDDLTTGHGASYYPAKEWGKLTTNTLCMGKFIKAVGILNKSKEQLMNNFSIIINEGESGFKITTNFDMKEYYCSTWVNVLDMLHTLHEQYNATKQHQETPKE